MSVTQTLKALDTALEASLPKHAQSAVCVIPKQARFAFEQEASAVQQAGDYRQREFAAGRICARSAISKLGIKSGPITMDEDGLPRWPEGVLAAISHSRGYCSAIATSDTYYRALGLDLEKTNRLSPAAIERVVHPLEAAFVKGDQKRASLLFCAKEAFYKAQYWEWHTSANFHDLVLSVDLGSGKATISQIDARFPQDLRDLAGLMEFRYRFFEDFVVCICWLKEFG
ncbi:MAG: 4'-phosphopantetheinyl transferase superfamily protein [Verrucomicrobiota bacterium]